ncbi:myosin-3 isoform X3 [Oryzias latipes]|uniref:myosin-3 isoform X3 n=1 Tax=Oryzias latipes TaxID=8090 RepID=UPI000CE23628|nr:myosin-3 isoform X3 [Oryzias latipes]
MTSAAEVLLLLFFFSLDPAQSQPRATVPGGASSVPSGSPQVPVLWDELQGLKELVLSLKMEEVRRRQSLRSVESQLRDGEVEAEQQRRSMEGLQAELGQQMVELRRRVEELEEQNKVRELLMLELQSRMNVTESSAEELRRKNSALASELPFLRTRLRASESTVEQLKRKNTVLASRLCGTETLLEELRGQMAELLTSNSSSMVMIPEAAALQSLLDGRLEKLQAHNEDQFSEMRIELNSSQILLGQLTRGAAAQAASVTQLQVRMDAAEKQLEDVHTETAGGPSLMELWRKVNRSESLQERVNTEIESRLRAGEDQLDHLQTDRSGQISSLESRLTGGLNRTAADVELRLRSTETQLEHLEAHTAALEVALRVREEQLEHLDSHTSGQISSIESRLTGGLNRTAGQISSLESRLTGGLNRTADVELRLRSTETQLEHLEAHTAGKSFSLCPSSPVPSFWSLRTLSCSALEVALRVREEQLEHLDSHTSVLTFRLNGTEQRLDELQTDCAVRAADLRSVSGGLTAAQEELQVQRAAINAAVEELNTKGGEELKVGFSAGLTDSGVVGPFDQETTLIFSKTVVNVGLGYNQSAGVFTAPVRGFYFFSFTAADYLKGYTGLHLYRNEEPVFFSLELNDHGGYASTCSSMALQLEAGDRVRLSLPASYRLYDDSRNFSVFSGFLLFPL